jgi:hypothetical protein
MVVLQPAFGIPSLLEATKNLSRRSQDSEAFIHDAVDLGKSLSTLFYYKPQVHAANGISGLKLWPA